MYNRISRLHIFILLIAAFLPLVGCGGKGTRNGTPYDIPIKVYRVIGPNGDSHSGPDFNDGCQLDNTEITSIVNSFIANAPALYGTLTTVTWDGVVYGMTDTQLPDRSNQSINTLLFRILSTGSTYYDSNVINLYFTGNYGGTGLFGGTADPHAVLSSNIGPHIFMNDGAGAGGSGGDVTEILRRLTLEHEVGHYLGRFNYDSVTMNGGGNDPGADPRANRTYASTASSPARLFPSGGGEHVATSYTLPHIMVDGYMLPAAGRMPVMPGVQFGTYTNFVLGAELGEVSKKLSGGNHNDWRR